MIGFKLAQEMKEAGFPQEPAIDISGIDGPFFGGFYYICKRDFNEPSGMAVGEVAPNFLDERKVRDYFDSDNWLVKIPQSSDLYAWFEKYAEGGSVCSLEMTYEWTVNNRQFPAYKVVLTQGRGCGEESVIWKNNASGHDTDEALCKLFLALKNKACCTDCFSPEHDTQRGFLTEAVPESCLDEDCHCHGI